MQVVFLHPVILVACFLSNGCEALAVKLTASFDPFQILTRRTIHLAFSVRQAIPFRAWPRKSWVWVLQKSTPAELNVRCSPDFNQSRSHGEGRQCTDCKAFEGETDLWLFDISWKLTVRRKRVPLKHVPKILHFWLVQLSSTAVLPWMDQWQYLQLKTAATQSCHAQP